MSSHALRTPLPLLYLSSLSKQSPRLPACQPHAHVCPRCCCCCCYYLQAEDTAGPSGSGRHSPPRFSAPGEVDINEEVDELLSFGKQLAPMRKSAARCAPGPIAARPYPEHAVSPLGIPSPS